MTTQELDALQALCDGIVEGGLDGCNVANYDVSNPGNAAFIASAFTALPALIAEVRRLRAEIDRNAVFLAAHGVYSFEPTKEAST